jgi:hypothetical protein
MLCQLGSSFTSYAALGEAQQLAPFDFELPNHWNGYSIATPWDIVSGEHKGHCFHAALPGSHLKPFEFLRASITCFS